MAETVWREYGASMDATADGQIVPNFTRIAADSEGCSTVSTDVADRVRMTFESTDVQSQRQHGNRVETTERVRREYG